MGSLTRSPFHAPRRCASICGLLLASLLVPPAAAAPVGYRGGVALAVENSVGARSAEATYTPTSRIAVGVRAEHDRALDHDFIGPALNVLVFRHNASSSQANLYLMSAVGVASGRYVIPTPNAAPLSVHASHLAAASGAAPGRVARFDRPAVFLGAQADWESRRFLLLAEAHRMAVEEQGSTVMYRGRIGVAPYIGEFGDLHTWLILQAEHFPYAGRQITLTPMVRLFKGPALVELGSSLQGDLFAALRLSF